MRAKMRVQSVDKPNSQLQTIIMQAVAASKYPEDGSDENNTYAKFTPNASVSISITNPVLFNKFEVGQEFYADFTPAKKPEERKAN